MKRSTPLKRGKPLARKAGGLKRSRIKKKVRRGDKPEVRRDFAAAQPRCACCGRTDWLESHHILNGAYGRVDDRRNLLRLCGAECHPRAEGERRRGPDGQVLPKLTLADCLALKQASDPEFYDREFLQRLMGKRILPAAALASEGLAERGAG
jgi:hypothetical protein